MTCPLGLLVFLWQRHHSFTRDPERASSLPRAAQRIRGQTSGWCPQLPTCKPQQLLPPFPAVLISPPWNPEQVQDPLMAVQGLTRRTLGGGEFTEFIHTHTHTHTHVRTHFVWLKGQTTFRGTWLAQLEEHVTLDLRVMSSNPKFI